VHYTYEDGHYVLHGGPQAMRSADLRFKEVAIIYSETPGAGTVLHKHGNAEWVQEAYDAMVTRYRAAGLGDMANELKIIRTTKLPVSELNKCISICDYVGRMVARQTQRAREAEEPALSM
jgi:hypothetical protein